MQLALIIVPLPIECTCRSSKVYKNIFYFMSSLFTLFTNVTKLRLWNYDTENIRKTGKGIGDWTELIIDDVEIHTFSKLP